jgi:hypothetical protein
MASTEQKKNFKAIIAVACIDELGGEPTKEEIDQMFLWACVNIQRYC